MKTLVLLAGESKEFEEQGYSYPKYLIEIGGKPLVQHVIESLKSLPNSQFIFLIRKEEADRFHFESILKLLVPDSKIIVIESLTKGAACTALYAIEHINDDEPLLIANGDQIVDIDVTEAVRSFQKKDLDGGIVVFDSVHPRWSYVRLDKDDMVIETAEKRPISKHATAGLYYFKKGRDFVRSTMNMITKAAQVGGLYYVCPVYNEMILKQSKVGIFRINREQYISLATPQGLNILTQHLEEKNKCLK